MTPQVLQEYLVSLGFSVNQAQLRTMGDAVRGTATSLAKLGGETVAAGIAISEMVERVARNFEDLYYMSQRTHSSVASLDAVSFAAQQVGISSTEAKSAVESFATALRHNPGLQGMLGGLGVGRGDPEEQLRGLVKRLAKYPDFIAVQWAQMFGIPEQVFLNYRNNMEVLEAAEEDHRQRMKTAGLDLDRDKDKWVEFTRVVDHLADQFNISGQRIATDWRSATQSVMGWLDQLIGKFNEADNKSQGTLGRVTSGLGAAAGGAGVMALIGRIFGFGTGLGARTLGAVGLPGAAAALMSDQNADAAMELRTALRSMMGITDPGEPMPWQKGGNWDWGQPGNDAFGTPRQWPPFSTANAPPPGAGKTSASGRVWGDDEAVAAGLYDPVVPMPRARPAGADVTVNQTNNFGDVRDLELTVGRVREINRELGDALRNLLPKYQ